MNEEYADDIMILSQEGNDAATESYRSPPKEGIEAVRNVRVMLKTNQGFSIRRFSAFGIVKGTRRTMGNLSHCSKRAPQILGVLWSNHI